MGVEYRVVWQREGGRCKEKRYIKRTAAQRKFDRLTGPAHGSCSHEPGYMEQPYCVWDRYDRMTEMPGVSEPPPWAIEPRIESREVGEWRCGAYGEDHSNGCPASTHYPLGAA